MGVVRWGKELGSGFTSSQNINENIIRKCEIVKTPGLYASETIKTDIISKIHHKILK